MYKCLYKEMSYLQGVGDPGIQSMFKFGLGSKGLNEELIGHTYDRQCK